MLLCLGIKRLGHGMILTDADRITLEYGHSIFSQNHF
jgi:hypothetical protein